MVDAISGGGTSTSITNVTGFSYAPPFPGGGVNPGDTFNASGTASSPVTITISWTNGANFEFADLLKNNVVIQTIDMNTITGTQAYSPIIVSNGDLISIVTHS